MKNLINRSNVLMMLAVILVAAAMGGCDSTGNESISSEEPATKETATEKAAAANGVSEEQQTGVAASGDKLVVAVSIVPQATFVEKVAGDLVEVVTIIPPGASPANYQPTPREMMGLEDSALYFAIGVAAEEANIMPNMVEGTNAKVVELQHVVGEVYEDRYFGAEEAHEHDDEDHEEHEHEEHEHEEEHDHEEHEHEEHEHEEEHGDHDGHDHGEGSRDPHIWLSPKRVIVMVEAIRDELSAADPTNAEAYAENAAAFVAELEAVDQEIGTMFESNERHEFIIFHPSIGYFADDYGLEMTALEQDGKSATAVWLQEVIDFAKEKDIHVIFYQAEFDSTQAETLADAIDGKTAQLAPLSPDYINNLKVMADAFLEN